MEVIDILILIPVAWFGVRGLIHGLIMELAGLLGLFIAAFAAFKLSGWVVAQLQLYGLAGKLLPILAIVLTFIAVFLLIKALSKSLDALSTAMALGIFNKLGGLIFGVFKALFLCSVLLYLLNYLDNNSTLISKEQKDKSYLYRPLFQSASFILPELSNATSQLKEKL